MTEPAILELEERNRYRSLVVLDDTPIVRKILRPGYSPPGSLFGDDVWDLLPGIKRENFRAAEGLLDFGRIEDPIWRITAKEYIYAALTQHLPEPRKKTPIHLTMAKFELYKFVRFMEFIHLRGFTRLADVTQECVHAYAVHVTNSKTGLPVQPEYSSQYLRIPIKLHGYGPYLSHDRLQFLPWGGTPSRRIVGGPRKKENTTPRIPEAVMGPYLRWALGYVTDFADEILNANATFRSIKGNPKKIQESVRFLGPGGTSYPVVERLADWIQRTRAAGRGVPYTRSKSQFAASAPWEEKPDRRRIAFEAGFAPGTWNCLDMRDRLRIMLDQAIDDLGRDTPVRQERLTMEWLCGGFSEAVARDELAYLLSACYIVVAYLSGARDSEVHSLRIGCLFTEATADGVTHRLKIRGTMYKGRGTSGTEAVWVVNEPVARAIRVLERIAALENRDSAAEHLFKRVSPSTARSGGFITGYTIQIYLNGFAAHASELAKRAADPEWPPLPSNDGEPWHFTTRQFRRTLAWYIANRPFGVVAGMLQYKHAEVTMFEGYAGTSDSGFVQEIEAEQELRRTLDLVDLYERAKSGERFAAPGSARLLEDMKRIREKIGDFPGRAADSARLQTLLVHRFRTLHAGILTDCDFVASRALCLQGVADGHRDSPLLHVCNPEDCPNSVMSEKHLPVLDRALADAKSLLTKKRSLPVFQVRAIQEDVQRIEQMRGRLLVRGDA